MTDKVVKLCFACEHFVYTQPVYWSEITYESEELYCSKGYLTSDENVYDRGWALIAETCKDYQLSDEIKKELNI